MPSALDRAVNIDDLRTLARRRTPRAIFDYIDGGADDELTMAANRQAWDTVLFRPRQAVRVPQCDTKTTILGCDLSVPILLGPVGYSRLFHPDGELGVARAAHAAGLGYLMSSFCGYHFSTFSPQNTGPLWYQLYMAGDRGVVEATLASAWRAGFKVLAITIDTNTPGMRERDIRNGTAQLAGGTIAEKMRHLPQLLVRPRWLTRFLLDRPAVLIYPNIILADGPMGVGDVKTMLASATLDWSDTKWIRQIWPGPIIFKGVLTGDDARRALDAGAAGVVVSNHGGRQLDSSYPTARALPEVVEAIGGRGVVLVDGGVRRGSHIAKALCMGAHAVLLGRAYAYGLAAGGEQGVARAIAILKADLERTLKLLGCERIEQLDASSIDRKALD